MSMSPHGVHAMRTVSRFGLNRGSNRIGQVRRTRYTLALHSVRRAEINAFSVSRVLRRLEVCPLMCGDVYRERNIHEALTCSVYSSITL